MTKDEAKRLAKDAVEAAYIKAEEPGGNHGWSEMATWEIRDSILDEIEEAFK